MKCYKVIFRHPGCEELDATIIYSNNIEASFADLENSNLKVEFLSYEEVQENDVELDNDYVGLVKNLIYILHESVEKCEMEVCDEPFDLDIFRENVLLIDKVFIDLKYRCNNPTYFCEY